MKELLSKQRSVWWQLEWDRRMWESRVIAEYCYKQLATINQPPPTITITISSETVFIATSQVISPVSNAWDCHHSVADWLSTLWDVNICWSGNTVQQWLGGKSIRNSELQLIPFQEKLWEKTVCKILFRNLWNSVNKWQDCSQSQE